MPESSEKSVRRRRVFIAALLLAAAAAALALLPVANWLQAALVWAEGNRAVSWLVFIMIYIIATIIASPTWILNVAGGYLFGFAGGLAVVLLAALAGTTATFLIARTVAYDWVHQRFADSPHFAAIDRALEKKALLVVTLTRMSLIIPYNLLNYMYGLTAVSLRNYVTGTFVGMLPVVAVYVTIGRGARNLDAIFSGDIEMGIAGKALLVAGVVLAVVVFAMVAHYASRALRRELDGPAEKSADK